MQKQFKPKVNLPSYVKVNAMTSGIPGYKKIMRNAIYDYETKRTENLRKLNKDTSKED